MRVTSLCDGGIQTGNGGFFASDAYTLVPSQTISFTSDNTVLFPDLINVELGCPCIRRDTWVQTCDGERIRVQDLRAGQQLYDYLGQSVVLENLIALETPSAKFVRIGANALGLNQPNCDVYLVAGHPVLYQGAEVPCEVLAQQGVAGVTEENTKPERVYTLTTQRRTFVDIMGMSVGTWATQDWKQLHGAEEGRLWKSQ